MGDHCRKQIRDALKTHLSANMATVQTVQSGRVHPLESDPLPALLVSTPAEALDPFNKNGDQSRVLSLVMEGYATGAAAADILDAIAVEAEALVLAGVPAWVKETQLTTTTVDLSGDAVNIAGVMRLEFDIVYHANPAAPDTPL